MLLLTSSSDKVQLVTVGSSVAVDVHASYVDLSGGGSSVVPSRRNTQVATATTTDVVLAPAASVQRNLKALVVRNIAAVQSVAVAVQHTDGVTTVELFSANLAHDEEIVYLEGSGFVVHDATGAIKTVEAGSQGFESTDAKTADFTLSAATSGHLYLNTGAVGAVVFTLPPWTLGFVAEFCVDAAQTETIRAQGADVIRFGDQTGTQASSGAPGNFARIVAAGPGRWVKSASSGAWSVS